MSELTHGRFCFRVSTGGPGGHHRWAAGIQVGREPARHKARESYPSENTSLPLALTELSIFFFLCVGGGGGGGGGGVGVGVGGVWPVGCSRQFWRHRQIWGPNVNNNIYILTHEYSSTGFEWRLVFGIVKFGEPEVEIPPFWHRNLAIKKTVRKPLSLKQKPPSVFLCRKVFYAQNSYLSNYTSLVCVKWIPKGENRCLPQFTA